LIFNNALIKGDSLVDLNELPVKYLDKIANDCNITFKKSSNKAEKIKIILNAGIPENNLKGLFEKYLNEYEASKKPKKEVKGTPTSITKLEERVSLLEEQVKYLTSKINGASVKLTEGPASEGARESSDLIEVKSIIKSKLLPGDSIAIDELTKIKELESFSLTIIEQAIFDLIDEDVLDASEGDSIQKMNGTIARLIRK
jgi:hypothetical protein